MKDHIICKFLAVLLCTAALFCSLVSVIGIAVTEQNNLYSEDVPGAIRDQQIQTLADAVRPVISKYLSEALGGCPTNLVEDYYSRYSTDSGLLYNTWGFELTDPDGTVVYCDYPDDRDSLQAHDFSMPVYYLYLIEGPMRTDGIYGRLVAPTELPSDPTVAPSEDESDSEPLPDDEFLFTYWDYDEECYFDAVIRDMYATGYTITVYYSDASFVNQHSWALVLFLWANRYVLFWILGISLLVFAITAVYLCCTAGRKPGSDEIKAGGFNALPLDLYLLGIGCILWLDYEIAQELFSWFYLSTAGMVFVGVCAVFIPSLLFVSYCFAWAAQIKEGSGRWWRKSAVGYGFRFAKIILSVTWETVWTAVRWIWDKVTGVFWWLGSKVERVFSLLPLTWQWILVGSAMVTILFLGIIYALTGHHPIGLLISVGVCLALVLYGAHAFGILLEGSKRMAKGELDEKVSDRLLLGSFRDFAGELNALGDVVKESARKEMKSERMKSELITNVSHDIKTPLTSIINYVDLLQKPHTPEEEQQYLEVLGRKSEQLKKLIQDLMEMSKASTGNMAVALDQVDPVEAVTQALGEFDHKLAQRRLTVIYHPPEEKLTMLADGRLTWRVLNNLLGNAVKYALPGTRLYVDIAAHRGTVRISLKNVSAEPLNISADELLERFVRGDTARNSEGSGLGLNIAKSLMEVQGGSLDLTVDGDLFKATLVFPAV